MLYVVPPPIKKTSDRLGTFAWNLGSLHKTFLERFWQLKFKIWSVCDFTKFQFLSDYKSCLIFFNSFCWLINLVFCTVYILLIIWVLLVGISLFQIFLLIKLNFLKKILIKSKSFLLVKKCHGSWMSFRTCDRGHDVLEFFNFYRFFVSLNWA